MLIYSSEGGTTRKVAHYLAARLNACPVMNAASLTATQNIEFSWLVLLCPTYGDAEFEQHFEQFLTSWDWARHRGTPYAFCELGIYTGYEEFGHGLAPVLDKVLMGHGLKPLVPTLSLDAVPITDWALVERWAHGIMTNLPSQP